MTDRTRKSAQYRFIQIVRGWLAGMGPVVAVLLAHPAAAAPIFQGIGTLGSGLSESSEAAAISSDGSTIVGRAFGQAYRWTFDTGLVGLGSLDPNFGFERGSQAFGVSGDGSVIVGLSSSARSSQEAFKWTLSNPSTGAGTMIGLGDLDGGPSRPPAPGDRDPNIRSRATAVSDDGNTIIGRGLDDEGNKAVSFSGGSATDLGVGNVIPKDISGDGSKFVDISETADGRFAATLFDISGGSQTLGFVPGRETQSLALGISQDGTTVVGQSQNFDPGSRAEEAFRWTAEGGMVGLGDLAGGDFDSQANAASGDGSIVVGRGETAGNRSRAFIWDETNGMRDLRQVLFEDFGLGTTGFIRLTEATGISADGRVITGNGINTSNRLEAWIAVLDPLTPPDDRFIWTGACGTAGWQDTCAPGGQTISNWEDSNGQPTISPPGASLPIDDVAEINNAAVTLQGPAASVQSLQATGSLDVQAPLSLAEDSGVQNLTVSDDLTTDGALNLNSQSDIANPVTDRWQAGRISGDSAAVAAGTSKVVVQPNASLEISGGDKALDTNLIVQGGARQLDGQLTIGNGGHLETTGTGRYEIVAGGITSTEAIVNAGTFGKVGGIVALSAAGADADPDRVVVDAPFVNQGGTIRVDKGRLTFTGENTHNGGNYAPGGGTTLEFFSNTTNVTGNLSATGGGNVELNGGTYTVKTGAAATFDLGGVSGLVLDQNVLVGAKGRLKNEGRLTFKDGTIDGGSVSGGIVTGGLENASGATFTILEGDGTKTLQGVLLNAGTVAHQNNTELVVDGGRIINRDGGEYMMTGGSIIKSGDSAGTFDNAGGTLRVRTPATVSDAAAIRTGFNMSNDGRVTVEQGVLFLQGAGNHQGSGTFDVRGVPLDLGGSGIGFLGAQTFDGAFNLVGSGQAVINNNVTVRSGSVTANLVGDRAELTLDDSAFLGGLRPTIDATSGSFINQGIFRAFNGTLTGGAVTDSGSQNGFQNRGGTLFVDSISGEDRLIVKDGVLRNAGGGTIDQDGTIELSNGIILNDAGGTFLTRNSVVLSNDDRSVFHNRGGTLKHTTAGIASATGLIDVPFMMTGGSVLVERETLAFSGPGMHEGSGEFTVNEGATLILGFGRDRRQSRFQGDYRIGGEGTVRVNGSLISEGTVTTNLTGSGKIVFDGTAAGGFSVAGATLNNEGNAEWRSGEFGVFRNDGGMLTVADGSAKRMRADFTNTGTVEHTAAANVFMVERAHLMNGGTYNLRGQLLAESTAQTITNQAGGTFRLAEPGATRSFAGTFDNQGAVEVVRGSRLELTGDVVSLGSEFGSGDVLRGTWVADGGSIRFGDGTARIDTNLGDITLTRGGTLSVLPISSDLNQRDFVNDGAFTLRDDKTFRTSRDFENNGTLRVLDTSELVVNGQFETNAGSVNRIDGTVTTADLDVDGGRFGGGGTINARRFNAMGGLIGPGNSPGIMEITGDYNHFAPAVLEIEIAGLIAGLDYDRLLVGGDANLFGGTLQVLLLDDFSPLLDQTFDILLAETITGAFDLFDVPTADGDPLFDLTVVDLIANGQQALRLTALATGLPDKEPPGGGSNDVPQPGFLLLLFAASLGLVIVHRAGLPGGSGGGTQAAWRLSIRLRSTY